MQPGLQGGEGKQRQKSLIDIQRNLHCMNQSYGEPVKDFREVTLSTFSTQKDHSESA